MASFIKYFKTGGYEYINYTASDASTACYSLTLTLDVASQNVVTNTSVINWAISAKTEAGFTKANVNSAVMGIGEPNSITFGTDDVNVSTPYKDVVVKVGGNEIYSSTTISKTIYKGQGAVTIASGSFTITHNSDGTYPSTVVDCSVRARNIYDVNDKACFTPYGDTDIGSKNEAKFSGTLTAPVIIPYGVLDSVSSFNDEQNPTITYTIPSGVTDVVAFISFSGQEETIAPRAIDLTKTSYTFNFTNAERTTLRSILSQGINTKQVTFHLRSITAGKTYYSSKNATLSIINYTPTLSPEVYDTNATTLALTNNKYVLVNGLSDAYYDAHAEGRKGATIRTQTAKNGDITKPTGTGTFEKVTSPNFYFTAIDSFGRSVLADYVIPTSNWIPYVKLTCSIEFTDMTADGDLTCTIKGKFYDGKFGANGKTNRMRVNYDVYENNEDDFTHVDLGYADTASSRGNSFYVSGNDYTYTLNITDLNYTSSYRFVVRVSDEVNPNLSMESASVVSPTPMFDWSRTDFNFNVPVTIQGGSVPSIVAQGTYGSWSYRKWNDGIYECWQRKAVSTTVTTASVTNWYSSGELALTNIVYPITFTEIPTVTVSLSPTSNTWAVLVPSNTAASTTKTGSYQLLTTYTHTTARDYIFNYYVRGKWK